jgi:hypothetical protein
LIAKHLRLNVIGYIDNKYRRINFSLRALFSLPVSRSDTLQLCVR